MTTTEIALATPSRSRGASLSRRDIRLGEILLAPALAYIFLLVAVLALLTHLTALQRIFYTRRAARSVERTGTLR